MHHPRTRAPRSGQPQPRLRRSFHLLIAATFALVLSACSTDVGQAGKSGALQLQSAEAEDAAVLGSAFVVREEEGASGGKVLVQPTGVRPSSEAAEDATVAFTVPVDGQYVLWARLKGASEQQNAVYLGFDGELERVEVFRYGEWVWVAVASTQLSAGEHVVSLGGAAPETSVDALVVSNRRDLRQEDLEAYLMEGTEPPAQEPSEPPAGEPGPGQDPAEGPSDEPSGGSKPSPVSGAFSLRGDPNFDISKLPADAQVWYRRLWTSIDDSVYDAYKWARSDNLYKYARDLHTHVQFLLHAFRLTGDLKLLDEIDYIAEIMRGELHDSWRDVREGSAAPGKDGYLNWVWRYSSGDQYYGKDDHQLDEIKTHALVASFAWALEVNRDLKSPGGRNYAAHADFWKDYLLNHFEAKWRERMKKPTGFPIMIRPHTHTYYSWTKWHYYMSLLTGDQAYLKEAERMAEMLRRDIVEVSTKSGPAFVWTRSVMGEGGKQDYLHPTMYARYVYHDAIEFFFEGFGWWDERTLEAMANTFATWVIDPQNATGSRDWYTGDIGGDKSRGGIRSDGWARMDYYRYEMSAYAEIAAWDRSGRIDDSTDDVLAKVGGASKPRYLALPVAKLVSAMLD